MPHPDSPPSCLHAVCRLHAPSCHLFVGLCHVALSIWRETVLTMNVTLIQVEPHRQQRGSTQQQMRCITVHALSQLTGILDTLFPIMLH